MFKKGDRVKLKVAGDWYNDHGGEVPVYNKVYIVDNINDTNGQTYLCLLGFNHIYNCGNRETYNSKSFRVVKTEMQIIYG